MLSRLATISTKMNDEQQQNHAFGLYKMAVEQTLKVTHDLQSDF